MPNTEEDFEAAIWRAMQVHRVTVPDALAFLHDITIAAQHYAAGDSPAVTAMRRQVLREAAGPEADSSPGACGGVRRAASGLDPSGPAASDPQVVADGGATGSTEASIPGPVTSDDGGLSTCG
jgi:hypothetical protein